jgi:hypothetical protein
MLGQWLSFSDDTVNIDIKTYHAGDGDETETSGESPAPAPAALHPGSSSSLADSIGKSISELSTRVAAIDIKLARAHAARELGAGKKGGVQSVCQALGCKELSKAPPWRKNHLCRTCFQQFINDEDKPSIPLKEGRTMSKGPPREGQTRASITIAALFFHHCQDHGILSDFRHDFNQHHNKSLQVLEAESKSIRVCALTGSVNAAVKTPRAHPVFAKLDSCGAVGATSLPGGFFGVSAGVRFSVNGINASTPFVTSECQPLAMLMHDEVSDSPFIACHGGMLKASDRDMSPDVVLSTNQMSDTWIDERGLEGARAHLS